MAEAITARELNRATLARQLLLERAPLNVTDAVRRVVALQAQQPASPYLALWNRLAGFDPAELDNAFASHWMAWHGRGSRPKRGRWCRCWRVASRRCTAATITGGPSWPAPSFPIPRPGCFPVHDQAPDASCG